MLGRITRMLTLLALLAIAAAPSPASARMFLDRSAPESASLAVQPVSHTQTSGGFAWDAAAIGAGVTLFVVGMGASAGVAGRRRRASRAAIA
jgi:hypothetical protein